MTPSPATPALVTTLYRELLRSCRRTRAVLRPTHVVLVGECVNRFAVRSPALQQSVKQFGPLPLPELVRDTFRKTDPRDSNRCLDDAFSALRMLHSVEQWVTSSKPAPMPASPPHVPHGHGHGLTMAAVCIRCVRRQCTVRFPRRFERPRGATGAEHRSGGLAASATAQGAASSSS